MTLKEELEILRGEPIHVFTGDPLDIPCIETSDPERLCKHPVVSVNMITFNHEPYIRQAIEGVMMQKTDFEFELVIGEDCSTDKTREICFEYQKRYPDKIRVLWCDHNLYRNPHPAGGNGARNMAHCRGEFIALCEGDDYWIDPLKLQKQVDVFRKYSTVGMVFTHTIELDNATGAMHESCHTKNLPKGLISSDNMCEMFLSSKRQRRASLTILHTANVVVRSSILRAERERLEIFRYRLRMGDVLLFSAMANVADVYSLPDITSVYRLTSTGAVATLGAGIGIDSRLARMVIYADHHGCTLDKVPEVLKDAFWIQTYSRLQRVEHSMRDIVKFLNKCRTTNSGWSIFFAFRRIWLLPLLVLPKNQFFYRQACRYLIYLPHISK